MEKIDISVIVPVYNCEKYLTRCVDSILAQTGIQLEIILIDDGSTDNSLSICLQYEQECHNIRVIASENFGPAAARNKGILAAKGEYLAFVDADDFIAPKMYSRMLAEAKKSEVDVVICGFSRFTPESVKTPVFSQILEENVIYDKETSEDIILKSYYQRLDPVIPSLWNKLYRRKVLRDHDLLIDENYVRAEDYWFNFEVFKVAERVSYLNEPFYFYWNNESSIMHTYRPNQFEQSSRTHERLLEYNQEFQFLFDKNQFYQSYLYETAVILREYYCRSSGKSDRYKRLREVIDTPVYQDAVKYRKFLPIHIRVLSWLASKKWYWMLDRVYQAWA